MHYGSTIGTISYTTARCAKRQSSRYWNGARAEILAPENANFPNDINIILIILFFFFFPLGVSLVGVGGGPAVAVVVAVDIVRDVQPTVHWN